MKPYFGQKSIDFSKYSSLKIGGVQQVWLLNTQNASEIWQYSPAIIGAANNCIIDEQNPPALAILDDRLDFIEIIKSKQGKTILKVGAKTNSSQLLKFCRTHNLGGFEFLAGLPGQIGGLTYMNAGLKNEEISARIAQVNINGIWIKKSDIAFSYRYSGIKGAILELWLLPKDDFGMQKYKSFLQIRKNHPTLPNGGSCFKNPQNDYAGRLIDAVGLKGVFWNEVGFSSQHANFLVNRCKNQTATFAQAIEAIKTAKKRVYETFGVTLELENKLITKTPLKQLGL